MRREKIELGPLESCVNNLWHEVRSGAGNILLQVGNIIYLVQQYLVRYCSMFHTYEKLTLQYSLL